MRRQAFRRPAKGDDCVPWYGIVLLICLVIGPFDALYVYIKAQKRKDELRRREEERKRAGDGEQ